MVKPKAAIRRFDIFAEYNRQKAVAEGMPADVAAGYGLWLAKVVAARRFRRTRTEPEAGEGERKGKEPSGEQLVHKKWRTLSGEPQTAALFKTEIVDRMGRDFYRKVLVPAIKEALGEGKEYTEIRDSLRRDWKPEP